MLSAIYDRRNAFPVRKKPNVWNETVGESYEQLQSRDVRPVKARTVREDAAGAKKPQTGEPDNGIQQAGCPT